MSSRKGIDPAITGSLIGLIGTVCVAVITIYATRQTPQQPVPSPTLAVPVADSTSTATSLPIETLTTETPSLTPTLTAFLATDTPIPPPAAGQDWPINCISELWQPYPSVSPVNVVNQCHIQPLDRFYTTGGRLGLSYGGTVGNSEVHGLFTRLPVNGSVRMNIFLQQVEGGEVIVGIFGAPDFNSSGVFIVAPTGNNVQKQRILVKTMPGQSLFAQTTEPIQADPPVYDFLFEYDGGTVRIKTRSDQIDFGAVNLPSSEKWLFIGYQLSNGQNQITAEFYNLTVTAR